MRSEIIRLFAWEKLKMYQKEYYVPKETGTYAETLEAYGLAHLLKEILKQNEIDLPKVQIKDIGSFYLVTSNYEITKEIVGSIRYFELFKYIKVDKDKSNDIPIDFIDYNSQKSKRDEFRKYSDDLFKKKGVNKISQSEIEMRLNEYADKPSSDFDIYSKMASPNHITCYREVFKKPSEKAMFPFFIKGVLSNYCSTIKDNSNKLLLSEINSEERKEIIKWLNEDVTALQIMSPSQAKGLSSGKLKMNADLPKISWLRQYLRFAGCYSAMIPKLVEVSKQTWDTKIYVVEPNSFEFGSLSIIYKEFKPILKGTSTIKLDILCLVEYCNKLIKYSEEYKSKLFTTSWRPNNYVAGFHLAYQKNLGQNNGISNISFLSIPTFIEINEFKEAEVWIAILDEHQKIIENLDEKNSSVTVLLLHYRQFLSGNLLRDYFEFSLAYNSYLMHELAYTKNTFIQPFSQHLMGAFFMSINKSLGNIIENKGFQAISDAIRNSTIKGQLRKKMNLNPLIDIKYGLTQDIKRKSLRKEDFISFIADFCADYNRQIGRLAENKKEHYKLITDNDLESFYKLIDQYTNDFSMIGKMLVSYGFSREEKEQNS